MHDKLQLTCLGTSQIIYQGQPVTGFVSDKVRALLIYLAVTGRAHSRDALAELLWADTPATRRENLKKALSNLRRREGVTLVEEGRHLVALDPAHYWVDVAEFDRLLTTAAPDAIDTLQRTVQLYQGDFLTGFNLSVSYEFEVWALGEQTRIKAQMVEVLRRLAEGYAQRHDLPQAIATLRRLLQIEPWREEAHRRLIELLALNNDVSAALAQFERCRAQLRAELDAEPSAAAVALVERIRRGEFDKPSPPPLITSAPDQPQTTSLLYDLWEAPDPGFFFGREAELSQVSQWLSDARCRMIAILGMGGIGKTSLAVTVVNSLVKDDLLSGLGERRFDKIIWRSLLNAPPLVDILRQLIQWLSNQQIIDLPLSLDEQLRLFLDLLRQQRVLIVLDNLESIMQTGARAGQYRDGYAAYGQLLQRLAQATHQSTLLLTSRERPQGLQRLNYDSAHVQMIELAGLPADAGCEIFRTRGIIVQDGATKNIVERYSGNPLALKLVTETIRSLYGGNPDIFLQDGPLIFDNIRDVLEEQFLRLSVVEQEILIWLAIEREPVSMEQLQENLIEAPAKRTLLELLYSLHRRSLIETYTITDDASVNDDRSAKSLLSLQNVVTEFLVDHLIERFVEEFKTGSSHYIARYALIKATAKTYIRQSQERLILARIAHRLQHDLGNARLLVDCQQILNRARSTPQSYRNYIAGNLLNLLRIAALRPAYLDCSSLTINQAFLQSIHWPNLNFRNAYFENTIFTESFSIISAVAISPNGSLLAAATVNGEIRIWNTADQRPQFLFSGHDAYISAITFNHDNQLLATTGNDGTIKLWDSTNAHLIAILYGPAEPVSAITFSPNGEKLISASYEPDLLVWDVVSRQVECRLQGHSGRIGAIAYHPQQDILASGSIDGTIHLWTIVDGKCFKEWQGHDHIVQDLKFSPDGQFLASSSHDKTLRLWELEPLRCCHTWPCTASDVSPLAFCANNRILASPGRNYTINLWDTITGNLRNVLIGHTANIRGLSFHPDGTKLYSGSEDSSLGIWDTNSGQLLTLHQGYLHRVWAVTFAQDDNALFTSSTISGIQSWTISASMEARSIDAATTNSRMVAISPDGKLLAYGGDGSTIHLFDLQSNRCRFVLTGHTSLVRTLVFDASGDLLISGGHDRSVRIWRVATGENVHVLEGHNGWVLSVAVNQTTGKIASGGVDKTIGIWDMVSGEAISYLVGHQDAVTALCFSENDNLLISGSSDCTICLWDAQTGLVKNILEGHTADVLTLSFSHLTGILASAGSDQVVKLWRVSTGEAIHTLEGHTRTIWKVATSHDGKVIASCADDGIKLWDAVNGVIMNSLQMPGPYTGMDITGATGLTPAQRTALKALGAVELD